MRSCEDHQILRMFGMSIVEHFNYLLDLIRVDLLKAEQTGKTRGFIRILLCTRLEYIDETLDVRFLNIRKPKEIPWPKSSVLLGNNLECFDCAIIISRSLV